MTAPDLDQLSPAEINERVARKLGKHFRHHPFNGKCSACGLDYCRDIAAAWEVVDSVRKLPVPAQGNFARALKEIAKPFDGDLLWFLWLCQDRPLAICKAFLRLS